MRFLLFFIILFSSITIFSQESKRSEAYKLYKNKEFIKAKELIDQAVENKETSNHPKSWYFKALIYTAIAKKGGKHDFSPAEIALKSVKRSKQLDKDNIYVNENKDLLLQLSVLFLNKGTTNYNAGYNNNDKNSYVKASRAFEQFFNVLEILGNDSTEVYSFINKNGIYISDLYSFAAYSAQQYGNIERAEKYYSKLTSLNKSLFAHDPTGMSFSFINYCKMLVNSKKHDKAVDVVDKAIKLWPERREIIMAELKIYKEAGKENELMSKYEKAVKIKPHDAELLAAVASKYDILYQEYYKENDKNKYLKYRTKAATYYTRAIDENPQNKFELYYNMAVLYYNPGVELYNKSLIYKNEDKKKAAKENYTKLFNKSISLMEKAYKINNTNKNLIDMMTRVYLILEDMDKAGEMKERYKKLENK